MSKAWGRRPPWSGYHFFTRHARTRRLQGNWKMWNIERAPQKGRERVIFKHLLEVRKHCCLLSPYSTPTTCVILTKRSANQPTINATIIEHLWLMIRLYADLRCEKGDQWTSQETNQKKNPRIILLDSSFVRSLCVTPALVLLTPVPLHSQEAQPSCAYSSSTPRQRVCWSYAISLTYMSLRTKVSNAWVTDLLLQV